MNLASSQMLAPSQDEFQALLNQVMQDLSDLVITLVPILKWVPMTTHELLRWQKGKSPEQLRSEYWVTINPVQQLLEDQD